MARRKWNIDTIKQVVEGEQPFPQFGYTGKKGPHKESDVWVDGKGIKWTIKNGNKIRVNEQADLIRDLCKRKCSDCGFDIFMLGNNLDQKTHTKFGKCFECHQKDEMILMADGKFHDHVKYKQLRTRLSLAKEFKKHTEESIKFLKSDDAKINMVMANGDITTFRGSKNNEFLVEVEKDLDKVNKLIAELEALSNKTI
jgi:hypothetical protein